MSGDKFICIELQGLGWDGDEDKRKKRDEAYEKLFKFLQGFLSGHIYVDAGASKTATVAVRRKLDQGGLHSVVIKGILVT